MTLYSTGVRRADRALVKTDSSRRSASLTSWAEAGAGRVSSFDGWGRRRIHGQRDAEDAALAGFALYRYLTAVLVHDLGDDRQAKSHSLRFGGEKRIENVLHLGRADAHAAVDHGDLGSAPFGARLHRDRAPGGSGLGRVQHRSEEHTSELQSLRHLVCRLLLEK